jgi:hypothetical protein
MAVRMARSSVNLRPPSVRVAVETRVRFGVELDAAVETRVGFGVAVGVGLATRVGSGVVVGAGLGTRVGFGVAVGATEDSSISASDFVAEASPLPANASSPAASIPLLRMRIKRCFRIKKNEALELDA